MTLELNQETQRKEGSGMGLEPQTTSTSVPAPSAGISEEETFLSSCQEMFQFIETPTPNTEGSAVELGIQASDSTSALAPGVVTSQGEYFVSSSQKMLQSVETEKKESNGMRQEFQATVPAPAVAKSQGEYFLSSVEEMLQFVDITQKTLPLVPDLSTNQGHKELEGDRKIKKVPTPEKDNDPSNARKVRNQEDVKVEKLTEGVLRKIDNVMEKVKESCLQAKQKSEPEIIKSPEEKSVGRQKAGITKPTALGNESTTQHSVPLAEEEDFTLHGVSEKMKFLKKTQKRSTKEQFLTNFQKARDLFESEHKGNTNTTAELCAHGNISKEPLVEPRLNHVDDREDIAQKTANVNSGGANLKVEQSQGKEDESTTQVNISRVSSSVQTTKNSPKQVVQARSKPEAESKCNPERSAQTSIASKIQTPAASEVIKPSASKIQTPAASEVIKPSASKVQAPAVSKNQTPASPKVQPIATSKVQTAITSKVQTTTTSKFQTPAKQKKFLEPVTQKKPVELPAQKGTQKKATKIEKRITPENLVEIAEQTKKLPLAIKKQAAEARLDESQTEEVNPSAPKPHPPQTSILDWRDSTLGENRRNSSSLLNVAAEPNTLHDTMACLTPGRQNPSENNLNSGNMTSVTPTSKNQPNSGPMDRGSGSDIENSDTRTSGQNAKDCDSSLNVFDNVSRGSDEDNVSITVVSSDSEEFHSARGAAEPLENSHEAGKSLEATNQDLWEDETGDETELPNCCDTLEELEEIMKNLSEEDATDRDDEVAEMKEEVSVVLEYLKQRGAEAGSSSLCRKLMEERQAVGKTFIVDEEAFDRRQERKHGKTMKKLEKKGKALDTMTEERKGVSVCESTSSESVYFSATEESPRPEGHECQRQEKTTSVERRPIAAEDLENHTLDARREKEEKLTGKEKSVASRSANDESEKQEAVTDLDPVRPFEPADIDEIPFMDAAAGEYIQAVDDDGVEVVDIATDVPEVGEVLESRFDSTITESDPSWPGVPKRGEVFYAQELAQLGYYFMDVTTDDEIRQEREQAELEGRVALKRQYLFKWVPRSHNKSEPNILHDWQDRKMPKEEVPSSSDTEMESDDDELWEIDEDDRESKSRKRKQDDDDVEVCSEYEEILEEISTDDDEKSKRKVVGSKKKNIKRTKRIESQELVMDEDLLLGLTRDEIERKDEEPLPSPSAQGESELVDPTHIPVVRKRDRMYDLYAPGNPIGDRDTVKWGPLPNMMDQDYIPIGGSRAIFEEFPQADVAPRPEPPKKPKRPRRESKPRGVTEVVSKRICPVMAENCMIEYCDLDGFALRHTNAYPLRENTVSTVPDQDVVWTLMALNAGLFPSTARRMRDALVVYATKNKTSIEKSSRELLYKYGVNIDEYIQDMGRKRLVDELSIFLYSKKYGKPGFMLGKTKPLSDCTHFNTDWNSEGVFLIAFVRHEDGEEDRIWMSKHKLLLSMAPGPLRNVNQTGASRGCGSVLDVPVDIISSSMRERAKTQKLKASYNRICASSILGEMSEEPRKETEEFDEITAVVSRGILESIGHDVLEGINQDLLESADEGVLESVGRLVAESSREVKAIGQAPNVPQSAVIATGQAPNVPPSAVIVTGQAPNEPPNVGKISGRAPNKPPSGAIATGQIPNKPPNVGKISGRAPNKPPSGAIATGQIPNVPPSVGIAIGQAANVLPNAGMAAGQVHVPNKPPRVEETTQAQNAQLAPIVAASKLPKAPPTKVQATGQTPNVPPSAMIATGQASNVLPSAVIATGQAPNVLPNVGMAAGQAQNALLALIVAAGKPPKAPPTKVQATGQTPNVPPSAVIATGHVKAALAPKALQNALKATTHTLTPQAACKDISRVKTEAKEYAAKKRNNVQKKQAVPPSPTPLLQQSGPSVMQLAAQDGWRHLVEGIGTTRVRPDFRLLPMSEYRKNLRHHNTSLSGPYRIGAEMFVNFYEEYVNRVMSYLVLEPESFLRSAEGYTQEGHTVILQLNARTLCRIPRLFRGPDIVHGAKRYVRIRMGGGQSILFHICDHFVDEPVERRISLVRTLLRRMCLVDPGHSLEEIITCYNPWIPGNLNGNNSNHGDCLVMAPPPNCFFRTVVLSDDEGIGEENTKTETEKPEENYEKKAATESEKLEESDHTIECHMEFNEKQEEEVKDVGASRVMIDSEEKHKKEGQKSPSKTQEKSEIVNAGAHVGLESVKNSDLEERDAMKNVNENQHNNNEAEVSQENAMDKESFESDYDPQKYTTRKTTETQPSKNTDKGIPVRGKKKEWRDQKGKATRFQSGLSFQAGDGMLEYWSDSDGESSDDCFLFVSSAGDVTPTVIDLTADVFPNLGVAGEPAGPSIQGDPIDLNMNELCQELEATQLHCKRKSESVQHKNVTKSGKDKRRRLSDKLRDFSE